MQTRVGLDDTFKVGNYILSIISRSNGMISWMVINIISSKVNVALKMYKIQINLI